MFSMEQVLLLLGVVAVCIGLGVAGWAARYAVRMRSEYDAKIVAIRSDYDKKLARMEGQIEVMQDTINQLSKGLDPKLVVNLQRGHANDNDQPAR